MGRRLKIPSSFTKRFAPGSQCSVMMIQIKTCVLICGLLFFKPFVTESIRIVKSSNYAVKGTDFTVSCLADANTIAVSLTYSTSTGIFTPVAVFVRPNQNNTCQIAGKPIDSYLYRCTNDSSRVIYNTTIPGQHLLDNLHLSEWECADVYNTADKSSFTLEVDVPISEVSVIPNKTEILEGRDMLFICTTDPGRPNAEIHWFSSDGSNLTNLASQQPDCNRPCVQTINSTSILRYTGKREDTGKSIVCRASNIPGRHVFSRDVNLNIVYGPSFVSLTPPNLFYIVNETLSVGPIICTADCSPNCTFTWNGTNLLGSTGASELIILNFTRSQEGQYQCKANNSLSSAFSDIINITVQYYGPSSVTLSPSTPLYTVNENQIVGPITCTADCRPDCAFLWTGPNLPAGTTSVLNLQNIHRNQTGTYQCIANNIIGSRTSVIVTINVHYGPFPLILNPPSLLYTVNETESIEPIICMAECRPNCTMVWSGPNIPIGTTNILNLQNINKSQAGSYTCEASNNVGSQRSRVVLVIVNYAPKIISLEGNHTYDESETAEFRCYVESVPKSTIMWTFIDGKLRKILNSDDKFIFVNGSMLSLQMSCLSMGLYTCEASNGFGTVNKSIEVSVLCTPRLNAIEYQITNHIILKEGDQLNITAPILAYPRPSVYWQLRFGIHKTNITSVIVNTHLFNRHFVSLYIEEMTISHFGTYALYASYGIFGTTYHIGNYDVLQAGDPTAKSRESSLPNAAGIGTGIGISIVCGVIILLIRYAVDRKRLKDSSSDYEKTEKSDGHGNVYNELEEKLNDDKENSKGCNIDSNQTYDEVVMSPELDKKKTVGSHSTTREERCINPPNSDGAFYMNTGI